MRAIIIEDEHIVAKTLQSKIGRMAPDVEVITILPSLKVARRWFMENAEPDLLFMDIQLSDGVSFELFDTYKLSCPIVFTTAYDDYAIRAFKVNGVDYILKPVEEDELLMAIDKCKAIIQRKQPGNGDISSLLKLFQAQGGKSNGYKEKFIVYMRNQWKPVGVDEIACFANNY